MKSDCRHAECFTFCASKPVSLRCLSCSLRIINGLPNSSNVIPCGRACKGIAVIFADVWKKGDVTVWPINLDFMDASVKNVRTLLAPVGPRPPLSSESSDYFTRVDPDLRAFHKTEKNGGGVGMTKESRALAFFLPLPGKSVLYLGEAEAPSTQMRKKKAIFMLF